MAFCLPPKEADKFKDALRKGKIDPYKLAEMTSEERRAFFEDLLGTGHGKPVNALFESKLLLKDFQKGLVTWAKTVAGLKPQARRDLESRIARLDKVLDPEDKEKFLHDLAEQKLGVGVTPEEAQTITDLSKKVQETRADMEAGGDRMAYGEAKVALTNYVNDLKQNSNKTTWADVKANPVGAAASAIANLPGTAKAIQASMDDSALFRQGWKTLFTNPIIWQKNARRSFVHLFGKYSGQQVMDAINADIYSRPNYDLYQKAKLDVGATEEAFPTSLPEKVPLLGRAYKRTEAAYTAFLHKTRADVFDKMMRVYEKGHGELPDGTELINIGRLVNALTGRGNLGHAERALGTINTVFFSPRNLKGHIDTLTQPLTGGTTLREVASGENTGSNFVRRQSAQNLLKSTAGTVAVLALAKWLKPDSVETDSRSADFGKIKIGNTRFDVTGGMGSLLTLMGRLITSQSKSSLTGKVSDLNSTAYGAKTKLDVLEDFFENKLSPMAGLLRDYAKGETFDGKKPTVAGQGLSLITPLPVKNLIELLQDPIAQKDPRFVAFAEAMDMLGISVNTYRKQPHQSVRQPDLDINALWKTLEPIVTKDDK